MKIFGISPQALEGFGKQKTQAQHGIQFLMVKKAIQLVVFH
jgi:hypothetical protein